MKNNFEVKDNRKINFTIIENEIIDSTELKPNEKLVYIVLCRFAFHGECYPSTAKIAEMVGLSRRTIFRIINRLCEKGLITKERRRTRESGNTSNVYTIVGIPNTKKDTPPYDKMSQPLCQNVISLMSQSHNPYDTMSPEEYLIEEYLSEENILTCDTSKNVSQPDTSPKEKINQEESVEGKVEGEDYKIVSHLYQTFKGYGIIKSHNWFAKQRKIARSLLKRYPLEEIHNTIDFAFKDEFWRSNFSGLEHFERVYQKTKMSRKPRLALVGGEDNSDDLFVRTI